MSRIVATRALGVFALAAFVACAESNDRPSDVSPGDDGGSLPPPSDAATDSGDPRDAGDAGTDDAGLPECSKHGYCHTVLPKHQTLRAVWSDDADATWAVSEEGAVLRYDAKNPSKGFGIHAKLTGPLWAVWGSGATDLWIGGETGLFHGTGASPESLVFTAVPAPGPDTPITSIWGTSASDVWAAGGLESMEESRLLHHTGAVPTAWSLVPVTNANMNLRRVFGGRTGDVWIAGQWENPDFFSRREIFLARRRPGGAAWIREVLPSDPAMPDSEGDFDRFYDAAVSTDGTSVWVLGRTHGRVPAFASATSSDGGKTFAFTFGTTGNTSLEPRYNAIGSVGTSHAFVIGDYGSFRYLEGLEWRAAIITVTKFPLTTPFYAMGGRESAFWFVGKDIALRRDPSKIQP